VRVTVDGGLPSIDTARRILVHDDGAGRLVALEEVAIGHPETVWERPIDGASDLAWLGDDGSIVVVEDGAAVHRLASDGSLRWRRSLDDLELEGVRRFGGVQALPSGHAIVALDGDGALAIELDGEGAVVWTLSAHEGLQAPAVIAVRD
ncbi:MAG: hypothetical protein AAGA20_10950, partial [Planctomycetota bacterium]